jgi:DNA-binding response OmpR family regulator
MEHKVVDADSNFLQKPFTLKQLAKRVRTVLEQPAKIAMLKAGRNETRANIKGSFESVFHL